MAVVLVCGGAGYIGSHMVRHLAENTDHRPVVLDNLSMGHRAAVPEGVPLVEGDIADTALVRSVLREHGVEAVMHFAAWWAVGESVERPADYYDNNVAATLRLLTAMKDEGVGAFVFSSSAAVYGTPERVPIREDFPLAPINPYGRTKLMVEQILADFERAYGTKYVCLRYFNAAGAHPDGRTGEDHSPETHLIPLVLQVALGKREKIYVFGDDYPTRDGTCVRDYVHVHDLATAHEAALDRILNGGESGAFNLGSGEGTTVLEVIEACREVTGREIPAERRPRRAGDPPALVADSGLAERELGWRKRYRRIEEIVETAWRWHSTHPDGYGDR